jgi:hypothetical protein
LRKRHEPFRGLFGPDARYVAGPGIRELYAEYGLKEFMETIGSVSVFSDCERVFWMRPFFTVGFPPAMIIPLVTTGIIRDNHWHLEPHWGNVRHRHDRFDEINRGLPFDFLIDPDRFKGKPAFLFRNLQAEMETDGTVFAATHPANDFRELIEEIPDPVQCSIMN